MKRLFPTIALSLTVLVLAGCDNMVEPISADREDTVALYGFLDMRAATQVIRLEALRSTILNQEDDLENVRVRSIAVGSGTFVEWRDSTGTDDAGKPVSLYVADFAPAAGTRYRLTATRDDVVLAEAITDVPAAPGLWIDLARGDENSLAQTVILRDMHGVPERVTVSFTVIDPDQPEPLTIAVPYGPLVQQPVTELIFDVTYYADRFVVMNALGRDFDEPGVQLVRVELTFDLPSPEWGDVDSSNLLGGLGFFASVGRYSYSWILDEQSVETLGWINAQ